MIKLIPVIIFSTVLLASCGGSDSEASNPDPKIGQVKEDLTTAKQIWQDNNLIDYSFVYYSIPDQGCLPDGVVIDPLPHRTVTVENNEVVYVENTQTGAPMATSNAETIEEIFDYLEQKLSEEPAVISQSSSNQDALPVFDESFGYPKSFYVRVDHDEGCDSLFLSLDDLR